MTTVSMRVLLKPEERMHQLRFRNVDTEGVELGHSSIRSKRGGEHNSFVLALKKEISVL